MYRQSWQTTCLTEEISSPMFGTSILNDQERNTKAQVNDKRRREATSNKRTVCPVWHFGSLLKSMVRENGGCSEEDQEGNGPIDFGRQGLILKYGDFRGLGGP